MALDLTLGVLAGAGGLLAAAGGGLGQGRPPHSTWPGGPTKPLARLLGPGERVVGARWATPADLRRLLVPQASVGRLVLGELPTRALLRRPFLVATERSHSVAVVGPPRAARPRRWPSRPSSVGAGRRWRAV